MSALGRSSTSTSLSAPPPDGSTEPYRLARTRKSANCRSWPSGLTVSPCPSHGSGGGGGQASRSIWDCDVIVGHVNSSQRPERLQFKSKGEMKSESHSGHKDPMTADSHLPLSCLGGGVRRWGQSTAAATGRACRPRSGRRPTSRTRPDRSTAETDSGRRAGESVRPETGSGRRAGESVRPETGSGGRAGESVRPETGSVRRAGESVRPETGSGEGQVSQSDQKQALEKGR